MQKSFDPMNAITSLQKTSGVLADVFRALIIIIGIIALSGIALVLLPQNTVEKIAARIERHRGSVEHEKIALVYLAEESANGAFHLRGVIRNISAAQTERVDAVVRLYSRNRELLETVVVRLDKDIIEPNDFARFEMTVPEYVDGFAGYAVEFKLREGGVLPYKDMRDQLTKKADP